MSNLIIKNRSYGYISKTKELAKNKFQQKINLNNSFKNKIKKNFLLFFVSLGVFGLLFLTIIVAWTSKDLPSEEGLIDRQIAESTKIYDRTGEHLLYEIYIDQKRTVVELKDIPQNLVNGAIATEDTKFYEHYGIRPLSIVRALIYGIFTNRRISGTSTLTQQLVKNAILTNERSYIRKIKEIILSLRIEQKFTKEQILKIYFNEIPYGSTNYGVESASQSYFGKHVSDLNLAESATLAGMPKAPSTYLNNLESLKNRRDFVLERMFEEKYISREEADQAQAEELKINQQYNNIDAPHFVFYVKEQLAKEFGEKFIATGGLKIITTLDWEKQQAAELAIKENEKLLEEAGGNNAALVAMEPKTGQILALVGSKDFFNDEIQGKFDVATIGKRQPGSSFKPIIYTAAFEKGYTPDTILFDVITNFAVSGKPYIPKNYDLKENGPVTMRKALQGSLNIPAVQTLYLVGAKKGVEFAERMGYTTLSEGDFGLTLVLGGGEVKLLDHVRAYTILANGGTKYQPVSILKVEDKTGKILKEWKKEKGEKVLDEKITATISNVLSDDASRAYIFGAGSTLTLPDRPVATKTGTTDNYVDAWTMGYTPSLVAGVWAGNTEFKPMKSGYGGGKVAGQIWNKFMREALKNTPKESFSTPPKNDAEKPILRGSEGGGVTLKIDKITNKLATSSTPEKYIVERTYIQPHCILHYVNKNDPRGPAPENPNDDPQYQIWENAIEDWIKRNKEKDPNWNISFNEPPTEYDDIHSLELIPSLEIIYPTPSSTLISRQIKTEIKTSAPRGVQKVIYKIDSKIVDTITSAPFNLDYFAFKLDSGNHFLTITVEDDVGNTIEEIIPFELKAEEGSPFVFWNKNNYRFSQNDFPKTISLSHYKLDKIKKINIYLKSDTNKNLIGSISDFSNLPDNQIMFIWNENPGIGNYKLTIDIELKTGIIVEGKTATVEIF